MFILWLSQLPYHTTGKPQFPWLFPDQFEIPGLFQVVQVSGHRVKRNRGGLTNRISF